MGKLSGRMKKIIGPMMILLSLMLTLSFTTVEMTSGDIDGISEARGSGDTILSWSDTFTDNSKISESQNVVITDEDVKLPTATAANNGFEIGTLGSVPDQWWEDDVNKGNGTFYHDLKTVDTDFFEGTRSLYGYSKLVPIGDVSSRNTRTYANMTSYVNASGISTVTVYMRDIRSYHPTQWGWFDVIQLVYSDGTKNVSRGYDPYNSTLYSTGEFIPTKNHYNSTIVGVDGKTWFVYHRGIPSEIDKSNMKVGIVWHVSNWRDDSEYNEISSVVDKITFDPPRTGHIISTPIEVPSNSYFDNLQISKSESLPDSFIKISVLDHLNDPIPGYIDLDITNSEMDLAGLDPFIYKTIKLKASFFSMGSQTPILHDWKLNFVMNENSMIEDLSSSSAHVKRGQSIRLFSNCSDIEEAEENLTVSFSYKSPVDPQWQSDHLTKIRYENQTWVIDLTIPLNASLGPYSVNISCQDEYGSMNFKIFPDVFEVENNVPVIVGLDIETALTGEPYSSTYSSVDEDGATSHWSMSTNASWLSHEVDEDEVMLFGVPKDDEQGQYGVTLIVVDGDGGIQERYFTIQVMFNDADEDGLGLFTENLLGTDPYDADSDSDGLTDGVEMELGTDPLIRDSDADGLIDGYEIENGLHPLDRDNDNIPDDMDQFPDDVDNDGISDLLDPFDDRYDLKITIDSSYVNEEGYLMLSWSLEGEEGIKVFTSYRILVAESEEDLTEAVNSDDEMEGVHVETINEQWIDHFSIPEMDPSKDYVIQMTITTGDVSTHSDPVRVESSVISIESPIGSNFILVNVLLIGFVVLGLMLIVGTRFSETFLLSLVTPFASRVVKKEKENTELRLRIFGLVEGVPGIHYRRIKETFNLGNGTCAYHLKKLEDDDLIKTKKDGVFKRYYPVVSGPERRSVETLSQIRQNIVKILQQSPGASLAEITYLLDEDKRRVGYHLTKMVEKKMINKNKDDKGHTMFYLQERFVMGDGMKGERG